ncbi:unnamed protein product [Candida verbasci]|uniref:Histone deacetylase n=1 Tax=Candida verbasci TaxID=1227364 RepID=A0A9W4TT41_9ASCO|nr:unnamed protein product [Candida verbasci]
MSEENNLHTEIKNETNIDDSEIHFDIKDDDGPKYKKIKIENNEVEKSAIENNSSNGDSKVVVIPPKKPQLFYTPLKTGLVYDVRMRYHAKIFTTYTEYTDPHPEDPRRIYRIYKKLVEAGLITDSDLSGIEEIGPLMLKIPIREADAEEILEVHSEKHLEFIKSTENMSRDQLLYETEKGDSIYVNNDSYLSAKLSCGGTIEACKAVIEGKVKNSLAIVRPPGHHAEPDTPGGFCLFSNVAVATKNLLKNYPESCRKIVILDWDIHHGNGTQKAFYDDPRVLYISLHRYENGKFYPGTKYGNSDQVGQGEGEGFNINIPWRNHGMHDGDYVYAFNKVILPVIMEFDPDLMIVSSGFDAADGDMIGLCHVSPAGYGYMTHMLKGLAKGKLAVVLEGGYNLESISKSALAVAKVLIGEPPENTITSQPHSESIEVIDEVIKIHSKYWKCLNNHGIPKTSFDDVYDLQDLDKARFNLINLADSIRSYQASNLFTKRNFISIPIINNPIFTIDLPNQVDDLILASPDIQDCSTIILSIHDPPEVWANINPINGTIESNSSIVLEHPLTSIIDKIEKENDSSNKEKIGFIDINIPSYQLIIPGLSSSPTPSSTTTSSSSTSYNPNIFAQEILLYLWDNYLSYFNNLKKLILIGIGESYSSILNLYSKRPSQEIKELVKVTIAFINRTNIKPLVPVMDESMVEWFYTNSFIFTSNFNPTWHNASNQPSSINGSIAEVDELKRPRKKFGRVLKSNSDGLFDIINEKFDECVDIILDEIEEESSTE